MIGMLKSMATTMKHALDGEKFTVQYPRDARRFPAVPGRSQVLTGALYLVSPM